jgi:hypothetical protein
MGMTTRFCLWRFELNSPPAVILVIFPFISNAFLKVVSSLLSGRIQRTELTALLYGHLPQGQKSLLSKEQLAVLHAVLDFSTAFITAGCTLLTSVIAFLVIVLRNPQNWLWWSWLLALGMAFALWMWIYTRKLPNDTILGLSVGKGILLLSLLFDAALACLTFVATQPSIP